ncbi:MAG: class poly(R)-hydroxyalkanoic acid synthase, partial [Pseudomonadota bacterium]
MNPFGKPMFNAPDMGQDVAGLFKTFSQLQIPPAELARIQGEYLREAGELWNTSLRDGGKVTLPKDRRFSAPEWSEQPVAGFAAANYLLNARTLMALAEAVQGDAKTRARIRFAIEQWVDASAPSNYLAL